MATAASASAAVMSTPGKPGAGMASGNLMAPSGASSTSALAVHSRSPACGGGAAGSAAGSGPTPMATSSTGPVSSADPYSSAGDGAMTPPGSGGEVRLSSYNPWAPQVRSSAVLCELLAAAVGTMWGGG